MSLARAARRWPSVSTLRSDVVNGDTDALLDGALELHTSEAVEVEVFGQAPASSWVARSPVASQGSCRESIRPFSHVAVETISPRTKISPEEPSRSSRPGSGLPMVPRLTWKGIESDEGGSLGHAMALDDGEAHAVPRISAEFSPQSRIRSPVAMSRRVNSAAMRSVGLASAASLVRYCDCRYTAPRRSALRRRASRSPA